MWKLASMIGLMAGCLAGPDPLEHESASQEAGYCDVSWTSENLEYCEGGAAEFHCAGSCPGCSDAFFGIDRSLGGCWCVVCGPAEME